MADTAYEKVKAARAAKRPTASDYIRGMLTDFVELHGDRRFADDKAIVAGLARLGGRSITVIGIEKGHSAKERVLHAFGAPNPEGYRKALRLMKQAEKFRRPVLCLVDTSGAFCGIGAEERGQGQAIAECLNELSALKTPVISVIIGEGGSGGALALSLADEVWMLENSIYSVISPEGCASILWKDASKAETAAQYLKLTAQDALELGIIDRIIPEDGLGDDIFFTRLRAVLSGRFQALCTASAEELLERRYARFRSIGAENAQ
jgi:acetyl-CoA carboxylase carboxyl transferase subunit alpha